MQTKGFAGNNPKETGKALFQKSIIAFMNKSAGLMAGFIFTYLVSHYYGPSSFGIFTLGLNMVQVFVMLSLFGFDSTLLRMIASRDEGKEFSPHTLYENVLRITIPLALLFSMLLWFLSSFIAGKWFDKPEMEHTLKWFTLTILPTSLLLIHASALRGLNKTGAFSFFRETARFLVAVLILILFLVFYPAGSDSPVISYMLAVILALGMSFLVWQKSAGKRVHLENRNSLPGSFSLLKATIPFFFISTMGQLFPLVNSLLLGIFGTTEDVGIFNVAIKIASLLSLPLMAVNMASATTFANLGETKNTAFLQEAASHSNRIVFWASFPLLLICLLVPHWLMEFFGSRFGAGSNVLVLVAIAQFVNATSGSVGVIMQMSGLERYWSRILLITTLLNILLMVLLTPRFGIQGAAFCYLIILSANNIMGAIVLKMKKNIRTFYIPFLHL